MRGAYELLVVMHVALPLDLVHALVQSSLCRAVLQHEEARVGLVP
jgi:hypothetical protein